MAKIDYEYIASLVEMAQRGDSNAFAELYFATYQKQYRFAYLYLDDEVAAREALQKTYISALKSINTIRDPHVFIEWITQINFRICFNLREKHIGDGSFPETKIVLIDDEDYIVRQLMGLPSSECIALILRYYDSYTISEIATLMECKQSAVHEYINNGRDRLHRIIYRS